MSNLSDEELMVRVQQGDAIAYQRLFERHHGRIYGYMVRRCGDRALAADLFQETFLAVHRARHTWQATRPFRPWLFGIAVNQLRDHARRNRRTIDVVDTELELDRGGPVVSQHSDARIHLEDAIAGLPDTLRDAFLLGVVEGFDHNEVAQLLEISPDNARARISRARKMLRLALEGEH